jgi:hypothetical protein
MWLELAQNPSIDSARGGALHSGSGAAATGDSFSSRCKYLPGHHRVFNAGNNPDVATAFAAGFDIDIEHSLQSLCPSH